MSEWRAIVVAAASASVLAAAATWFVTYQPDVAETADEGSVQYPLERASFSDPQPVTITLRPGTATTVDAPVDGVVTRTECEEGTELVTGAILTEVDQQPIVVVRTDAPLFRDLTGGEQGADVAAFQTELSALGYRPTSSGTFDWTTRAATHAFLEDRGIRRSWEEWGTLPLRSVAWIAPGDTTVERCAVRVGDPIGVGDALVQLADDPGSIDYRVAGDPVEGDRELVVAGIRVPAPASPIDDPSVVRAIIATPEGAAAAARDEKTLGATLELATPIDAYPVPPSALFAIDGAAACVSDGGRSHAVTIVASSLGLTYITFAGPVPASVDVFPPRASACE